MSEALVAVPVELSRAAWAAAVSGPLLALDGAVPRERVRASRPIKNARSLGGRFPSDVGLGPTPRVLLLEDLLPKDLDCGPLNLLNSQACPRHESGPRHPSVPDARVIAAGSGPGDDAAAGAGSMVGFSP